MPIYIITKQPDYHLLTLIQVYSVYYTLDCRPKDRIFFDMYIFFGEPTGAKIFTVGGRDTSEGSAMVFFRQLLFPY